MKFHIEEGQCAQFREKGSVELANVLLEEEAATLATTYKLLVEKKWGKTKKEYLSLEEYLLAGKDLWRTDATAKRQVCSRACPEVVSQLTRKTPVRLGTTQLFYGLPQHVLNSAALQTHSLEQASSFQGVLAGLILCLQPGKVPEGSSLPQQAGNGLFFNAHLPLDTNALVHAEGGLYLLIVYLSDRALYVEHPQDLLNNYPKQFGYFYGDRLKEEHYPILFR